MQLGIKARKAIKIDICQPLGCELAAFNPARKLCDGSKSKVIVFGGQGHALIRATDESIAQ
jgi:hypothetical protein